MADTITVACPKCKKTSKAPASIKGKKIRCKGCGETFAAEEFTAHSEEWGVVSGYGVTAIKDVPRCPFCAHDLESADQVVCLKCGYNLQTRERLQPKVLEPVAFGDYFLWWLPGILAFLLILGQIFFIVYLWVWWPKASWTPDWMKDNPVPHQIYSSVLAAFIIVKAAQWIVKKRVLHPHPPEVEKLQIEREKE